MSTIYGNPITVGGTKLEIICNVDSGSTVTATKGSKSVSGVSVGGRAKLKVPEAGEWNVVAVKGSSTSNSQTAVLIDSCEVTLLFVDPALNNNSWDIIQSVSAAGVGSNYWSIGDCKQVTLNGRVSDGLTLSNYSAWVYIIGFDHNAEREGSGIAFQGFKATQNGTDVCLADSAYGNNKTSGTWFNMNNSSTNSGGWASSRMRTVVMPLIKAALPADLQAVIKASTIYTTQGSGNGACTATADDVFLLAEYEIFGARSYASTQEPSYLRQYAYYAAGNSKVKYQHNSTTSAAKWWERSPRADGSSTFCNVNANGSANNNYANYCNGVAPAFKI